jgi:GNAT superfamily N-acetyltransferase
MAEEIRIEQLESSDKAEASKVLAQAFSGIRSPMPATQPRIIRVLVSTIRRVLGRNIGMRAKPILFSGFANFITYGIRKDGRLVCVAVVSEAEKMPQRPPILSKIVLWLLGLIGLISLVVFWVGRMLRRQVALEAERLGKEMSEYYKGRYLELVPLGTLPAYQKQGFGREMLHFIRREAESKGYEGICLFTDPDTPAFQLYLKEGFMVEKDFKIASESTVLMRLAFVTNPLPTTDTGR